VKHTLTKKQRAALIEWAAEGLQLAEINDRAAECDPPFKVEYNQLKHVRRQANKQFSRLRDEFEKDALDEGLARRAVRIRELEALFDRHLALIKARADEMDGEVAGGHTGLLVRDYRGKEADRAVYKYDAALVKEARGLFDDIAREKGERRQGIDLALTKELDAFLDRLKDNLDADTYAKVLALAAGVEAS
jgi:hypothetical protein